jgi:hypothetical protein
MLSAILEGAEVQTVDAIFLIILFALFLGSVGLVAAIERWGDGQ